jgi:tRNA1(Val) A37 N6-methylase TrmN6
LPVNDLLHPSGIPIVQSDDSFRYTLDSLLLAYYTPLTRTDERIVDLCSGNAPVALYLSRRTTANIDTVDNHLPAIQNARASVAMNHLEHQIKVHLLDVQTAYQTLGNDFYDVVVCNPPYLTAAKHQAMVKAPRQAVARHEVSLTLEDVIIAAKRLLKNKGILSMIHRTDRLDELMQICLKHRMVVKTLRFVHSQGSESSQVMIVTIKKGARAGGLQVLPPVITMDEFHQYTEQIKAIYDGRFVL